MLCGTSSVSGLLRFLHSAVSTVHSPEVLLPPRRMSGAYLHGRSTLYREDEASGCGTIKPSCAKRLCLCPASIRAYLQCTDPTAAATADEVHHRTLCRRRPGCHPDLILPSASQVRPVSPHYQPCCGLRVLYCRAQRTLSHRSRRWPHDRPCSRIFAFPGRALAFERPIACP